VQKIALEDLGLDHRVRVWSPQGASGYFGDAGPGVSGLGVSAIVASDLLAQGLYDVRPVEREPGAARSIYERYLAELVQRIEEEGLRGLSHGRTIREALSGRTFGAADILKRAATELAAVKGDGEVPCILMVGENYVRLEPFANDFLIESLEERGLRVRLVPLGEWLEYLAWLRLRENGRPSLRTRLAHRIQLRIHQRLYRAMARPLGWTQRIDVAQVLATGSPYVRPELHGEALLTVGAVLHEWNRGEIDGAVVVGPLECLPTKVAEAQLFHAAEREGFRSLVLPFNGDPVDPEVLDSFAYDIHAARGRNGGEQSARRAP
jgi:predicted nucleotide-binding protein (sugar kinase/HSP70/actin superfamily)